MSSTLNAAIAGLIILSTLYHFAMFLPETRMEDKSSPEPAMASPVTSPVSEGRKETAPVANDCATGKELVLYQEPRLFLPDSHLEGCSIHREGLSEGHSSCEECCSHSTAPLVVEFSWDANWAWLVST